MFNLQGSEIIIVLLLALVVLGPEKLPDAMRKMGQAYAELKKMSSGFQNEFRSVMDEPMREIRDTANLLRDSADFTKLQAGERDEKPKSAEMASTDSDDASADDAPRFEAPTEDTEGPGLAADSRPAPFSDEPQVSQRSTSTAIPAPPPPFTGMSSTVPAGRSSSDDGLTDDGVTDDGDVTAGDGGVGDGGVGDGGVGDGGVGDGGVGDVRRDVSERASGDADPISDGGSPAQVDGDGAGLADGRGTDTPADDTATADHASTDDEIDDESDID